MWRSLASGLYLMDYLRGYLMDYFMDYLKDYLRFYWRDYLRGYLSIVEPLAVLAAFTMTEDP